MRTVVFRSWVLLFMIVLVAGAAGQTVDDGIAAAQAGDMNQAIEIWTPLAEAGDVNAQQNFAIMYRLGQGVTADQERFRDLLSSAANKGFPASLFLIGSFYYFGEGIEPDLEMARGLIQDAANQGDPQAIQALQEWF
jgi:TPR repeat protein